MGNPMKAINQNKRKDGLQGKYRTFEKCWDGFISDEIGTS